MFWKERNDEITLCGMAIPCETQEKGLYWKLQ